MKKRARTGLFDRLLSKVLLWVAGRAIELLPVVGPIFKVINLAHEIAEVSRASAPA